ncbi:MAG: hypothetical protein OEU95_05000 [Nitrospirota bacterium]|nr:hypothetical protein [Nitrospirota bacterium]
MINIVFGLMAICIGLWGVSKFWWYFVDIISGLFPMLLIFVGIVAVVAGIRKDGLSASVVHAAKEEPAARKKRDV